MKKLFFLLSFLIASTIAFSQNGMVKSSLTAEEKADEVVAKMDQTIDLTDEQIPKVKTLALDKVNKVTDAQKKYGKDKNRLQAANKMIYDEFDKGLKGVLTEDQYTKYKASKGY